MTAIERQKGFTLIEIVMILILISLLGAVALSKYFDLKQDAREQAAISFANAYCAEINMVAAREILSGKSCQEALFGKPDGYEEGERGGAFNTVTPDYMYYKPDFYVKDSKESKPWETIDVYAWGSNDVWHVPSTIFKCDQPIKP